MNYKALCFATILMFFGSACNEAALSSDSTQSDATSINDGGDNDSGILSDAQNDDATSTDTITIEADADTSEDDVSEDDTSDDDTSEEVVTPAAGGVDKSSEWADLNFPLVPRSSSRVGNAGGKYHYYQFNVGHDKYAGGIAFAPAPFSGNSLFNVWISEQPGHAAITKGQCHSPTSNEGTMRYVTNIPEAEERMYCKLTPGIYYVNIADGIDALSGVTASAEGNCTLPAGCGYYLETTGIKK